MSSAATIKRIKNGFDRHYAFKVALCIATVISIPIITFMIQSMLEQEEAVTEWKAIPMKVINSTTVNMKERRRSKFKFRAEWGIDITYTYAINEIEYTGTNVWFYGTSAGNSRLLANEVVSQYEIDSTGIAYVSNSDPHESILIRELWFRPYGCILLYLMIVQLLLWYALVEHDWSKYPFSPKVFPPHDTEPNLHHIHTSEKLRPIRHFVSAALFIGSWHFIGGYLYTRFTTLSSYLLYGYAEQLTAYHMIGVLLAIRLAYLGVFSYYVNDAILLIDHSRVIVDTAHTFILKQSVNHPSGSVFYKLGIISLFKYETTQVLRNNKAGRDRKLLYKKELQLFQGLEVSGELEHKISPVMFNSITEELKPQSNVTVYIDWFVVIDLSIRYMPFDYSITIPVHVHPQPTSSTTKKIR